MSTHTPDPPVAANSPAAEAAATDAAMTEPVASVAPANEKGAPEAVDGATDKPIENGRADAAAAPTTDDNGKADATAAPTTDENGKSDQRGVKRANDDDDSDDGGHSKKTRVHGDFKKDVSELEKRRIHNMHKEDFGKLPETDDPDQIRAQVEFYFSDTNLAMDRHMFIQSGGPRNNPLPVKKLADFKRMRRFQPYSAIVAALRESEILEVVDDGDFAGFGKEAVRRKAPIEIPTFESDDKEVTTKDMSLEEMFERVSFAAHNSVNSLERSVYVRNFGDEKDAGQVDLENFFKPYGSISVRKRRNGDDSSWKGSIFVEFGTKEEQEAFLALDPKPKYNGHELYIEGKKDYSSRKCAEKGIKPSWEKPLKFRPSNYARNSGSGLGHGGGRGGPRGGPRGDGQQGRGRGSGRHNDRDRDHRRSGHKRSRSPNHRDRGSYRDRDNRDRASRGAGYRRNRDRPRSYSPSAHRRRDRRDRSGSADNKDKDWKERRDQDQRKDRRQSPKPDTSKTTKFEEE